MVRGRIMRIEENSHDGYGYYSRELQERVGEVFQCVSQITQIKRLLAEIKKESARLRTLFLTDEEKEEIREESSFFDTRMQEMAYYTFENLEAYQQFGWKELINEGDDSDE